MKKWRIKELKPLFLSGIYMIVQRNDWNSREATTGASCYTLEHTLSNSTNLTPLSLKIEPTDMNL